MHLKALMNICSKWGESPSKVDPESISTPGIARLRGCPQQHQPYEDYSEEKASVRISDNVTHCHEKIMKSNFSDAFIGGS